MRLFSFLILILLPWSAFGDQEEYLFKSLELLNLEREQISSYHLEEHIFKNGCLECPQQSTACTMGLVPGYIITIEHNNTQFIVHADNHAGRLCVPAHNDSMHAK